MKKIILPIIIGVTMLSGCGTKVEVQKQYVEPKYEETVYFKSIYNEKHIDVEVNGEKRMYPIGEEFKELASTFEENDLIKIEYVTDSELRKIVKNIELVKKNNEMTEQEKITDQTYSEDTKDKEEKVIENQQIKVYDGEEMKDVEATLHEMDDIANALVLKGYVPTIESNDISIKNKEYNTSIKFTKIDEEADIKKQRWRAAEELQKNGILKETKNIIVLEQMKDAEFIFYSQGEKIKKYIIVKKISNQLTNIEVSMPNGYVATEKEYEIWAMAEAFSWK